MASIINRSLGGDPILPDHPDNDTTSLIPARPVGFPLPAFAKALKTKDGQTLPQAIAHRGYKAKYPENSMAAFKGALAAGAHALETDIHLTKDGVVVLSHDPTLKRCFDKPDKIIDLEWNYLKTLKTTMEPHEPLPRLKDFLIYLSLPENDKIWTLLDIKTDNDPDDVMRLIAEAIKSVPPSKNRSWEDRIVLGVWATKYVPLCDKYLSGFPISIISFSLTYADQFLKVENASFNLLIWALMAPLGSRFIKKAHEANRSVYAWTVLEEKHMRWCIEKQIDGVIADDPKKFLEVCKDWEKEPKSVRWTVREWLYILRLQFLIGIYYCLFRWRMGSGIDKKYIQQKQTISKKDL